MEKFESIQLLKNDIVRQNVRLGKRLDDRPFLSYRKLEIIPGYIPKAEGSCLVKLGNTKVLAGIKLSIEEPFPDTPASGMLMVGAELDPIASEYFTAGPPDENSIELARVVDRGIRESKCIDLEKLCIVPGEKVWNVFIDIYVLDHDGNLFDASSVAAVNALYNCYFPEIKDDKIIYEKHTDQKLPMVDIPCSTTFVKIENSLLLDPTFDEECTADARLTITTTKDGKLCAMQKGGPGDFTEEELKTMLNISISKGAELRSLFKI